MKKKNDNKLSLPNYKAIIGIDESYANTGISLCINKKIYKAKSLIAKSKNEMRLLIQKEIENFVSIVIEDFKFQKEEIAIIFERVRLFSNSFISTQYMINMSYLNAAIIMKATEIDIKCYSVDTKCWKSHVVGSSKSQENKYGVDPKKFLTLNFCMKNSELKNYIIEFEENKRKQKKCYKTKNGKFVRFNDNVADSICISIFFFVINKEEAEKLLKIEE